MSEPKEPAPEQPADITINFKPEIRLVDGEFQIWINGQRWVRADPQLLNAERKEPKAPCLDFCGRMECDAGCVHKK